MADQFKIDSKNYMGYEYEAFTEHLYGLALSDPKKYFEMRAAVLKSVRDDVVEQFFATFYNALTSGTTADGTTVIHDEFTTHPPKYPSQDVSKILIGVGKTINSMVEDVISLIVPAKFESLANARAHDKASAAGL
jgi:hypothetical protein